MKSIGIDIGKRGCIVCIMDRNGAVLEETGYKNTYAAADALARKTKREYGKCQVVCESTGDLWIKTYEAFEDRGIPIELANPMRVRAIAEASVKTDKVDARTLAHLLRTNLIARCHVAERRFLPPYTPQLNPTEILWREIKRPLSCRYFESEEDLERAITEIVGGGELKDVKTMDYLAA